MKRQRSLERNYSSSEEENDRIGGRMNSEANANHRKNSSNPSPSRDSSSVLAQLIAQTQQLSSSEFCLMGMIWGELESFVTMII
jgi:hypothetical protein